MNFSIIGAGRLGKNIALALFANQIANLQYVFNRNIHSGELACRALGSGTPTAQIEALSASQLIWITSNDDAIHDIVTMLAKDTLLKPGTIVIHCSGVLDSTLFHPLRDQGCFAASFHPLKAFRSGYLSVHAFENVVCVLEGDEQACVWIKRSFAPLGSEIITIHPEAKAAYHAAACIASNYLVTLASCSEHLLLEAGITSHKARELIKRLMQSSIDNLQQTPSIADALTGPLARGDKETLRLHLHAIDNPLIKNLYTTAALTTLPLTPLSDHQKNTIEELLLSSTEL